MGRRTFVIAATQEDGRAWCPRGGVKPYAKSTVIVSRPMHLAGVPIRPEDRVVYVPSVRLLKTEVVEAVLLSQRKGRPRET